MDNTAILEDLNAHYFAAAKQLILLDRAAAKVYLGLDDETIDVILKMTPAEMLAICKTNVPQYRLFVSAKNLASAVKALQPSSQKAWMYLAREKVHAVA